MGLSSKDIKGMKIRELKAVLKERGVGCKGCASKSEYAKKVKETNHLDKPKRADGEEEDEWMMDFAWNCAKGLFACRPCFFLLPYSAVLSKMKKMKSRNVR